MDVHPVVVGDEAGHFAEVGRSEYGVPGFLSPALVVGVRQYFKRLTPRCDKVAERGGSVFVGVVALACPDAGIGAGDERRALSVEQTQLPLVNFALGVAQVAEQFRQCPFVLIGSKRPQGWVEIECQPVQNGGGG